MKLHFRLVEEAYIDQSGHRYYGAAIGNSSTAERSHAAEVVWQDEIRAMSNDDDWCTYLDSIEIARDFRRRYAMCGLNFRIQGACVCETEQQFESIKRLDGFLGLDVSSIEPHSVLHPAGIWRDYAKDDIPRALLPIVLLEQKYFRPKLNDWGLLDCFEDAVLLRDLTWAEAEIDGSLGTPRQPHILGIVLEPSG